MPEALQVSDIVTVASWSIHSLQPARCVAVVALQCRWAGYMDFLPKSCPGLPLFWAAEDLQRLRGSPALDKMTGRGCSYTHFLEQPSEAGLHSSPHMHAHTCRALHAPWNAR